MLNSEQKNSYIFIEIKVSISTIMNLQATDTSYEF